MSDPNPPGQPYPYGGQQPPYGGEPQSPPPYNQPPYNQPGYGQPPPQYGAPQPPYPQPPYAAPPQPYPPAQQPYGAAPPPYVQPGAPPPFGTFPPPQPEKRSRGPVLAIVGGSLALLLILCVGGAFFFGSGILSESDATLSTPDTVAGLQKMTRTELQSAVDTMAKSVESDRGWENPIAAFYEDPADPQKMVMLVGGTTFLLRPGAELDSQLKAFEESNGSTIKDLRDVDAGELGGVMRCGTGTVISVPLTLCAWADHGSLVMAGFYNRALDESAALLRQIRSEILKRN